MIRMTGRRKVPIDHDFVRDIRRSARSVPANTAEGHHRFRPKDNHRFLEIARASLKETEEHLVDGLESGYFEKAEYDEAQRYVRRTSVAMARLMRYLRSTAAEANYQKLINREKNP